MSIGIATIFSGVGKPIVKKGSRALPGTMGYAVRAERLRRGWVQAELAQKAGIGQSQVSVIENAPSGKVRAVTVFGVAGAFGCDPLALFHGHILPARVPGEAILGKEAHRLELRLTPESMRLWIAYGNGLADKQPITELEEVAAIRKGSRK